MSPGCARSRPCRGRRAIALPLAMMLVVVIALTVGVMMRRQTAQSFTVARQLTAYQEHHGREGIQQAIRVWLQTQTSEEIPDSIDDDGYALDLVLAGNEHISVYLHDGQGTALRDLGGLTDTDAYECAAILAQLLERVDPAEARLLTRSVGPRGISLQGADERLIAAAVEASVGEEFASDVTKNLLERRTQDSVQPRDITLAGSTVGVERDELNTLGRAITTEPVLWYVLAESRRGAVGGEPIRYGGLYQLGSGAVGDVGGRFLTWERYERPEDLPAWFQARR